MTWIVAKTESIILRTYVNGTEDSTGSASVRFRRNNAGTDQYWNGGSTWTTGSFTFAMTFVSGVGWRYSLTVPASAQGFTVTAESAHSNGALGSESHYVTVDDLDSALTITNTNAGATVRGG